MLKLLSAFNFLSVMSSVVSNIVITGLIVSAGNEKLAMIMVILNYISMALGGVFLSFISKYFTSTVLLFSLEGIRAAILLSVAIFFNDDELILLFLNFCLSLVSTSYHSIKLTKLISLKSNESFKKIITWIQSSEGVINIIAPLIGAFSYVFVKLDILIIIDVLTYISFTLLLFRFSNEDQTTKSHSVLQGLREILKEKKLKHMTLSRIGINFPSSLSSLIIPYVISLSLGNEKYVIGLSVVATSQAISFMTLSYFFSLGVKLPKIFTISCLASFANVSLLVFTYSFQQSHFTILILSGLLSGLSSSGFRLGGITVGLAITPKQIMHVIIASGDSIVRSSTAIFSVIAGSIIVLNYDFTLTYFVYLLAVISLFFSVLTYIKLAAMDDEELNL